MAQTKVAGVQDGPRLTVNTLIKNPTVIQKRLITMMQNQFIVDSLLRRLPPTDSGMYEYHESTPLFADGDAEIVEEFGEIPTIGGKVGDRKVAYTVKRALALLISEEMRRRNNIDRVNVQQTQIKNTMIRTWETAFFRTLLAHPDIPNLPATSAWDGASSKIRTDLSEAISLIEDATTGEEQNYLGFTPNTLVIGRRTRTDLIQSDDFAKVYSDKLIDRAPAYTGTLPGQFYGLTIMVSREMDRLAPGKALLLERGTVGGIGDERPTTVTPLVQDPNRETWRSNTIRQSAIVIDQPKAAAWITGVSS